MLLLIFYFSSQAGSPENSAAWLVGILRWLAPQLAEQLTPEQLHLLNYIFRKTGHGTGYLILTLLGYWAFRRSFGNGLPVSRRALGCPHEPAACGPRRDSPSVRAWAHGHARRCDDRRRWNRAGSVAHSAKDIPKRQARLTEQPTPYFCQFSARSCILARNVL
jgi:hypothetical protein